MKIIIRESDFSTGTSKSVAGQAVRYAVIDLMNSHQLDRFFRAKRVWWDSSKVVNKNILSGLVFEE